MMRAPFIALASIALFAEPAIAEIFKCVDAAGNVTFVNDRSACPDAEPHPLKGRIDRAPSAAALAKEEEPIPGKASSPEQRLEWVLLDERDVYPGWKVTNEAPEDPTKDPDLVEWGVVAKRARHYRRQSGGVSQVCSVELWAFENDARARLAHQNFDFPDWQFDRSGDTLVMLHAVTVPGGAKERAIYPDCEKLGEIVRARAAKLAGE